MTIFGQLVMGLPGSGELFASELLLIINQVKLTFSFNYRQN
jgi:hypothetical protein